MRKNLVLYIISFFLFLSHACTFEKNQDSLDKKRSEKSQKLKKYDEINRQLNTNEDCVICDSNQIFHSLEDFLNLERFKGKVVYLDFWGTGCRPCLEQFSYLPELKKRFKDEPVEYVYVTTYGKNLGGYHKTLWRTLIKKHNLSGINLMISRKAKERFYARHRNIVDPQWANVVPVYLLIDKKGTVINYVAPRPSTKEVLYTEIQELLDKDII